MISFSFVFSEFVAVNCFTISVTSPMIAVRRRERKCVYVRACVCERERGRERERDLEV